MIVDQDTGEILGGKFAKMFFRDIGKLFGLSAIGYGVLMLMAKNIGLGNVSSINMNPRRKKEYAEILGCSVRQINNQLKVMTDNNVAKITEPDEYPNRYTINPDIIFSGNDYQRVKVLIEYSGGERSLKVFSDIEQAREYLNSNEEKVEL